MKTEEIILGLYRLYNEDCIEDSAKEILVNAVTMLNAMTPKIIPMEDVIDPDAPKPDWMWCEFRYIGGHWVRRTTAEDFEYNIKRRGARHDCRYWTTRPSEEESKAVEWEDE